MSDELAANEGGTDGQTVREPVNQLGCVVADLDKAIQGWVELGVGPWLTMHHVEIRGYQSQHTVKAHTRSIYRKLGVSSRSQAIERAQQLGLLPV